MFKLITMKSRNSLLSILLILLFSQLGMAQGIDFFHGTWKEALELSKTEGKLLFVDANTAWCGPCRRMAANVFTQDKVGDFYNQHFINLKIDMEKGDTDFRARYSVRAYPTLLFIDESGEIVKKKVGGQRANGLIQLGKDALALFDNVDDLDELFQKGKRDVAFLRKYVKALNNSGKPSTKAVNEYLRQQKDLTTEENLNFIFDAVTSADSKVFDLMIKHKSAIENLHGKEKVNKLVLRACSKTVETAIEFKDENLLKEAKKIMKSHYPDAAKSFGYQSDMKFYAATKDEAKYFKSAKKYAKKVVKKDASLQNKLAVNASKAFPNNKAITTFSENLAKKAALTGGLWNYYFDYAQILATNKKSKEAIKFAKQALDLATKNKGQTGNIRRLLRVLEHESKERT